MATVLAKKHTIADIPEDILDAILVLATDKHQRLLIEDECEWLETKMKEIARLVRILKRKGSR